MATSFARSLHRIIPQFARLDQRQTYGTLDDVYTAATAELELSNYKNAWTLFMEALGQDMLKRWRAMPKHENSKQHSRKTLIEKLRGAKQIDSWEYKLLTFLCDQNPGQFTLRQTDILAAIVRVFAFHYAGPRIDPKPAPPATPLPNEAEVAAEKQRLAAERAAFLERGDEIASPHWRQHHRALSALGLCG